MVRAASFGSCLFGAFCLAILAGCSLAPTKYDLALVSKIEHSGPNPHAPRHAPLESRVFAGVTADTELLGAMQVLFAHHENTLSDLARVHDLGYQELRSANPGVDAWLPGEGTPIYLPTMAIVPDTPREGIVLNLPSMRLLYFVHEDPALGPRSSYSVTSHPIGIGREGWATPTGVAHITEKKRDPNWYPPASVRAEHAAAGDPLPPLVPPGPDNPLGRFKMRLSMPGYLIHGTNKPGGVGMRVSHGCIRLYPEDIELLFERVPSRTRVEIVDQPVLAGWRDGELYLEVHTPLSEDERDLEAEAKRVIDLALSRADIGDVPLDMAAVARIVREQRGFPFPILKRTVSLEQYLAASRIIKNVMPGNFQEVTAGR